MEVIYNIFFAQTFSKIYPYTIGDTARKSMITAVNCEALIIEISNCLANNGCKGCVAYITDKTMMIQ